MRCSSSSACTVAGVSITIPGEVTRLFSLPVHLAGATPGLAPPAVGVVDPLTHDDLLLARREAGVRREFGAAEGDPSGPVDAEPAVVGLRRRVDGVPLPI